MDTPIEIKTLSLTSSPVERVWGGERLAQQLKLDSKAPIGEMWLAFDENQVKTGPLSGVKLADAIKTLGSGFLGKTPFERYGLELPLLIKFLDAAEWLSVQVHPDDQYAHTVEKETGFHGKTEAWYILEGEGEIVYGLNQTESRNSLELSANDGSIWEKLHRQTVHPGQVAFVPAGTIHALGPGLVLYEVQQRSDLTYRIFDYGRGRELHLEKGLDVSTFTPTPIPSPTPVQTPEKDVLLASSAFVMEKYALEGRKEIQAPSESFLLLTVVKGIAEWSEGSLTWGDTLMVGAGQRVALEGNAIILGAYLPSAETLDGFPASLLV